MSISATDPIGLAMSRTGRMLFKPFDIKKWFVLGFAATLVALILQLWAEYRRVRRGGDRWKAQSQDLHLDESQQPGLD